MRSIDTHPVYPTETEGKSRGEILLSLYRNPQLSNSVEGRVEIGLNRNCCFPRNLEIQFKHAVPAFVSVKFEIPITMQSKSENPEKGTPRSIERTAEICVIQTAQRLFRSRFLSPFSGSTRISIFPRSFV